MNSQAASCFCGLRILPEMVAYTDKLVAKLVDRIDALGLGEKTLSYAMMPSTTSPWMSVRLNSRPAYR